MFFSRVEGCILYRPTIILFNSNPNNCSTSAANCFINGTCNIYELRFVDGICATNVACSSYKLHILIKMCVTMLFFVTLYFFNTLITMDFHQAIIFYTEIETNYIISELYQNYDLISGMQIVFNSCYIFYLTKLHEEDLIVYRIFKLDFLFKQSFT